MVTYPLHTLNKFHIILASNSPRRKELLKKLGIDFEVRTLQNINESYPPTLKGEEIPLYIARFKAQAYTSTLQDNDLLITADTIVCLDNIVLGKPHSTDEASAMLNLLSGRRHQVITGVSLTTLSKQKNFAVTSEVCFSKLGQDEINYYINQFMPMDKAGAYGIQEWIGMIGVSELHGSFFNVMGLPIQRLYQELKHFM